MGTVFRLGIDDRGTLGERRAPIAGCGELR
jgi:hypothetical protein